MTTPELVQLVLRTLLAAVFAFMGVTHFVPRVARGMRAMIPPALRRPGMPSPAFLVAFTGVAELAGAVGLLAPWPLLRQLTGIALVVFLILVFPANAFASQHREKFGRAAIPFWPRFIAQLVLIALVLAATVPFS
ncbi:MAG: DoxX family protein [Pseudolysinimonas sp.]